MDARTPGLVPASHWGCLSAFSVLALLWPWSGVSALGVGSSDGHLPQTLASRHCAWHRRLLRAARCRLQGEKASWRWCVEDHQPVQGNQETIHWRALQCRESTLRLPSSRRPF